MKKLNINQCIYVRLNDKGYAKLYEEYNKYNRFGIYFTMDELIERAKDGYYPIQFHEFVDIFGKEYYEALFDFNILINEKDLQDVIL